MESSGISPADVAVDDDDEAVEVRIGTVISSCRNLRSFLSMNHIRHTDLITMLSQYETVLVAAAPLESISFGAAHDFFILAQGYRLYGFGFDCIL